MEKYKSCFDDEEIDLQVLLHMSESELDSILYWNQETWTTKETDASYIRCVCVCLFVCVS